jgi:hypothetical protein
VHTDIYNAFLGKTKATQCTTLVSGVGMTKDYHTLYVNFKVSKKT